MSAHGGHSRGPIVPGPKYSFTLSWEQQFDYKAALEMFNNEWHIPLILAALVYLPVLYFGQLLMRGREPFSAKLAMLLWNSGLAVFSIVGLSRVAPEFLHSLSRGFYHSVCNNSYVQVNEANFWIYLFVLSKIPELCDTVFLVLRKQRLIFLHVYHHATVLVLSWFVYANAMASARWFCTMNFFVHAIMYTYYALKGLPTLVRIPKWVSIVITSLQTLQMVAGAYVVVASYYLKLTGRPCSTTTPMALFALFIYLSYLYLFASFFRGAYCAARPASRRDHSPPRSQASAEQAAKAPLRRRA